MTDFEETVFIDAYKWAYLKYGEFINGLGMQQIIKEYWVTKLN